MAVVLAASAFAPGAQAGEPLTREDLAAVRRLANARKSELSCSPVEPNAAPPADNVASAAEYARIAGMYAFVAMHYPSDAPGDRASQINDLIDDASRAYERAYDCVPGEANAFYLLRAIELIGNRVVHLIKVQGHAEDTPRVSELAARRDHLVARLPAAHQCPVCLASERECPAPEVRTGYAGLHQGRLALEVAFGGGQAFLGGVSPGRLSHLTVRLHFGPRFVLGARHRHVLGAGVLYALHPVLRHDSETLPSGPPVRASALHQAGPYLEYAFAARRHFSLLAQAELDVTAGVVWFDRGAESRPISFHAVGGGGGIGVCTLWSALCLRGRGYASVGATLKGYDVTLGLDVFRLADKIVGRREASK